MRHVALAMILAACGGGGDNPKHDAASQPQDAPGSTVDAPPLPACTPVNGTNVKTRMVTQVPGSPLLVTAPPGDGRLFVVMQDGRILIVENDQVRATAFLDISNTNIAADNPTGERGLLGLAFSPNYASDRTFYVMYTLSNADVVARFHASATDPYVADGMAGEVILSIPDFAPNHNGGMIEFGKDGFLYIGTGDGGSGSDPRRNSQALTRGGMTEPLLGKILRIDVNTTSTGKNYGIPDGNPFKASGGEPEIFVIGLRNPWRWSFDRMTGDMWIADVGQGTQTKVGIEEVTVLKDGQIAGKNLGWSMYEASTCFGNYTCNTAGMTMPQVERSGSAGWHAIIGGEVYRGTCYPDLVGTYFFTDYQRGGMSKATMSGDTVTATELPAPQGGWPTAPSSIHGDARGELFITTAPANANGRIYQIEAAP
jgi:glucose/arabinose dehydrogenase